MRKEVFICDICGQEVSAKDICHIDVNTSGTVQIRSANSFMGKHFDACRACLDAKGFRIAPKDDGKNVAIAAPAQEKSVEDLLLDLLTALGVQFEG